MGIRVRDLGRAIRLLEDHVRLSGGDPFARDMLHELGRLIPADFVEFYELRAHDKAGVQYETSQDDPDSPPASDEGFSAYRHLNPLGAFKWQPSDGVVRLSSLISHRELRNLPLFEFYWGYHGIRDQLKIWLRQGPRSAVCINLDRHSGTFSDRDADMLEVLRPHLMLAYAGRTPAHDTPVNEATLTRREAQVLSFAASGRTNQEIADLLVISPGTVRKHLERAYGKLGVQNRTEAIAALRQAIVR